MGLTVVTGPPCAGKSSWVLARARVGDIVIDMDRIAQALTAPGADRHSYGRTLRTVAQQVRQAAVTEALKHVGKVDVWVIHTDPSADRLASYHQAGGQVVTLDPGMEVVLARCREQRPPAVVAAVKRWYSTRPAVPLPSHTGSQTGSREW